MSAFKRAITPNQPVVDVVAAIAQQAAKAKQTGELAKAKAFYQQAFELDNQRPELWFNYGNLLQAMGDRAQAERAYQQAISLQPSFYQAHLNLANSRRDAHDFDAAIAHYQRTIQLKPDFALTYKNLGQLLIKQKQYPGAAQVFANWCRLEKQLEAQTPTPLNGLGIALQAQGQYEKALTLFQQALALDPQRFDSLNNLGTLLRLLRRPHEAIPYLRQAVEIDPNSDLALTNLVYALLNLGQVSEALSQTERVLQQHPNSAPGHLMRGFALVQRAQPVEAIASFERAWELNKSASEPIANALFTMLYRDDLSGPAFVQERQKWIDRLAQPKSVFQRWAGSKEPERRLKVGYLSGDLRSHPVAFFLEPILANHSEQVEAYCYDVAGVEDETTQRLKGYAQQWRRCVGTSNEAIAQQIYNDEIDILVDLIGHTAGSRPGVLQRKPAPIQMLYIGYPGSTGLKEVDYVISDSAVSPAEHSGLYTEKILPIEGSFWCFQPRESMPEPNPLPAIENGYVTFGSFNNSPKLSPVTIQLWARILTKLPTAKLKLKALALGDEGTKQHFLEQFVHFGAKPQQVIFEGPTLKIEAFFQSYHHIDIALDSTPYNGGTTTCESLWMGVPVVTLRGERFCSRMSHSLLNNVGLAELSTSSERDYVECAVKLAKKLEKLEEIRRTLRVKMAASPICQAQQAARAVEEGYRRAWQMFVS